MTVGRKRKVTRKMTDPMHGAREAMWTHYKDNKEVYIDEIRKFRNDILFELVSGQDVIAVFSKYKKNIFKVL
jgi:hypothetical protein